MRNWLMIGALLGSVCACSAATPAAEAPSAAKAETTTEADAAPQAKQDETTEYSSDKLAHYTSDKGDLGFVLDRTTATAKVKFDGKDDVVELTPTDGPTRGSTAYLDPKGRELIVVDQWGSMTAAESGRHQPVYVDRHATLKPLPNATIAGQASTE
jgi:hypothetical protein